MQSHWSHLQGLQINCFFRDLFLLKHISQKPVSLYSTRTVTVPVGADIGNSHEYMQALFRINI